MFNKTLKDVIVGPVGHEYSGVSRHIMAIQKYSSHQVDIFPGAFGRAMMNAAPFGFEIFTKSNRWLATLKSRVVHSHVDPWFTKICRRSKQHKKNIRWVHSFHAYYFPEDLGGKLTRWQEVINKCLVEDAKNADVKISVSKWMRDFLYSKFSIESQYIPNGFDMTQCDTAVGDLFINEYGLRDFVVFVGNIQPIKNPGLFVRLAAELNDIPFVMIGSGINRQNLEKICRKPIPANLHILGALPHSTTLDAIAASRVFVMTSLRESQPTVLLEAIALGKNVVAPAHSGCREIVQNTGCGLLYDPQQFDDLVDHVKQSYDHPSKNPTAREKIISIYDWKNVIRPIDKLYGD